ncbi:MAG: hypothetical protein PUA61_09820 [Succinatimonas hippei]|nr:hypothetical protein [Succinatimonas hippei]
MSYLVNNSNTELSNYVQSLLSSSGNSGSTASATTAELGNAKAFSTDLTGVLLSQKDNSDESIKNKGQLVLNKALYNGVHDDPDEKNTTDGNVKSDQSNSTIEGLKMLSENSTNATEWQKVFPENQQSDYSVLDSLGNGLLTAAKIAGSVIPFL